MTTCIRLHVVMRTCRHVASVASEKKIFEKIWGSTPKNDVVEKHVFYTFHDSTNIFGSKKLSRIFGRTWCIFVDVECRKTRFLKNRQKSTERPTTVGTCTLVDMYE
jgi:hypothetical protein